ncbi:hypothetical protein WMF11_12125 [Sorangium sp. So ce295]|uniref:hypothetical protein n=1 Tax=Sorangium sp. So ce295 TaxID=3133295 RepID=UPI003F64452E
MAAAPTFKARKAEISGHLFENPSAGVPRGIYWSCNIDFAPMLHARESEEDGEGWPCMLLCDWITWPVRSWREMDGLTLECCVRPLEVEASLYFFGRHQPLSRIELSFQRSRADRFRVRGGFLADLDDIAGCTLRAVTSEFDLEGRFVGLSVLPDNLFPKPKSEAQAIDALGEFADLQAYERPQWEETSWLFKPRIDDAAG